MYVTEKGVNTFGKHIINLYKIIKLLLVNRSKGNNIATVVAIVLFMTQILLALKTSY